MINNHIVKDKILQGLLSQNGKLKGICFNLKIVQTASFYMYMYHVHRKIVSGRKNDGAIAKRIKRNRAEYATRTR